MLHVSYHNFFLNIKFMVFSQAKHGYAASTQVESVSLPHQGSADTGISVIVDSCHLLKAPSVLPMC